MKLAIMQPYLFPYLGYFQLINAVDKFVFYDDVNYIKGGWINRNNILHNGEKKYFTLTLKESSSFKKINQIIIGGRTDKLLKTINQAYSKAPYFHKVYSIIEDVFSCMTHNSLISEIAAVSVIKTSEYLCLKAKFEFSSENYNDTIEFERTDRLLEICKRNNTSTYINAVGGKKLYCKEEFKASKIDLHFLETKIMEYEQFENKFIPSLSIIDVLMFNSPEVIHKMLDNYELI
jgi:hypothetical protein